MEKKYLYFGIILILLISIPFASASFLDNIFNLFKKTEKVNTTIIKDNQMINNINQNKATFDYIILSCKKETLEDSVYCINKYIKDNYHYIPSKVTTNYTDILMNGGNCESYTNFYQKILTEYGYEFRKVYLPAKNNNYHYIGIVNDRIDGTIYCLVDMMDYYCRRWA